MARLGTTYKGILLPIDLEAPDQAKWVPTDEEIKLACQKIQKGWTDLERRQRMVGKDRPEARVGKASRRDIDGGRVIAKKHDD